MRMRAKYLPGMWLLLVSCAAQQAPAAAPDALEIVRRSVSRDNRNWILARNYVYTQRAERR